jgi:DinB superfamily
VTSRAPASRVDAIHTAAEYSRFPIEARLGRLQQTPEELAQAISGKTDAELSRRPDAHNWAAKEIVCHLRDVEELFQIRFHTVVALEEPRILVVGASATDLAAWRIGGEIGHPLDPGRWAEERQYLRNAAGEALAAFRRRRTEVLTLLRSLSPAEWERGGIHLSRGRLTLGEWVASLAAHDDNHLAQLHRALEGRP